MKKKCFLLFNSTADGVYMVTNKMNRQVMDLIVLKTHIGTESQLIEIQTSGTKSDCPFRNSL